MISNLATGFGRMTAFARTTIVLAARIGAPVMPNCRRCPTGACEPSCEAPREAGSIGGYWAAAAIDGAAATGRWARRKVRIWRTASGILSGVSFHGIKAHLRVGRK